MLIIMQATKSATDPRHRSGSLVEHHSRGLACRHWVESMRVPHAPAVAIQGGPARLRSRERPSGAPIDPGGSDALVKVPTLGATASAPDFVLTTAESASFVKTLNSDPWHARALPTARSNRPRGEVAPTHPQSLSDWNKVTICAMSQTRFDRPRVPAR